MRPERQIPTKREDRPTRTPIGARNRLSFPKDQQDPAYHYRVVNDTDDRLNRFLEAGYEFVTGDSALGDARAGEAGSIDSRVSKPVGGGTRGFLMRIKKEWYEEDQAAKAAHINELEAATKPNAQHAQYGEGIIDK